MATKTRNKGIPELTFGDRLGIARKKAGLTQHQMAQQLRVNGKPVSEATIAKWETDGGQPRDQFSIIRQWSDLTNVREDWLIFGYMQEAESGFITRWNCTPSPRNGSENNRPFDNRPSTRDNRPTTRVA